MDVLRWTTDTPTEPGEYWFTRPSDINGWKTITLCRRKGILTTPFVMQGAWPVVFQQASSLEFGTRWAGPIPKPKPPLKGRPK